MTRTPRLSPAMRGSLLVVAAATCSGFLGPLATLLYGSGMEPSAFVVWRAIVGVAGILVIVAWQRRRADGEAVFVRLGGLERREQAGLALFIGSNIVLNVSLFVAFDRIPIAIALLTFYTYPVMLAMYGRLSGSERIGPVKVLALVLATIGLALVVLAGYNPSGGGIDPLGLGLAFLAALSATTWVGAGRITRRVPAEQAMGIALAGTAVIVGAVLVLVGQGAALLFPIREPGSLPTIVVAGVLSGAVAAVIFTKGMRLISRVRAGILGLLEPIVGTTVAAVALGQVLTPVQLLGGALVLASAVLIQREREDEAAAGIIEPAPEDFPAPAGVV